MDWDKASVDLSKKLDPSHVKPAKQFGPKGDYLEGFEAKIHFEPNSGCWLWAGADNGVGYGKYRGKYAHRVAYEAARGAIPEGMFLDHLCRVRCCVNPDHLEPVTNVENIRRGMAGHHMKNGGAQVGEQHPGHRITASEVIDLRKQYAEGASQYALARLFGISQPTVSQIVRRKTWEHV